ncbi:MAG: hypothetical protein ACQES7_09940 [Pseudomonadota bacterium]
MNAVNDVWVKLQREDNMLPVVLKACLIWIGILVLAIANGVVREAILLPWLGEVAAYRVSGLLLSALILGMAYLALPWLPELSPQQYGWLGLGWLALTLVFEFSFGLAQGKSWPEMLAAYTFQQGNLWPVVLAVTLSAPYLAARMRGWM